DAFDRDHKNPVLIDKYLTGREIEVMLYVIKKIY
ncbi:putative carbamoyl-phosphate synthase large chain 2, partial [Clostridioides difficile CD22]